MNDSPAAAEVHRLTMHQLLPIDIQPYVSMLRRRAWLDPQPFAESIGIWQATVGCLNRIFFLHHETSGGGARAETSVMFESGAPIRLLARTVQFLTAVKPVVSAGRSASLFELRMYTLVDGGLDLYVPLLLDVLPARERFSPNVGIWRSSTEGSEQLVHLWAYEDAAQRQALRPAIDADPAWCRFVPRILPLIREMQSYFLAPITISPTGKKEPR